jgi:hypothetical protein
MEITERPCSSLEHSGDGRLRGRGRLAEDRERPVEGPARGLLDGVWGSVQYCALVYAQTGRYLETAWRLGIDRRTVRAKVDRAAVVALQGTARADPTGRASADGARPRAEAKRFAQTADVSPRGAASPA